MRQNFLLKKDKLSAFLKALSKEMRVFVPSVKEGNVTCFLPYRGQELFFAQTLYSPKKILHPPLEKEFFFRKKNYSFEVVCFLNKKKQLIFGVRPCDTHAVRAFDKLFLEYFHEDPLYKSIRENTLLVALQCNEPCENGFCQSLGTHKPVGHDLLLVEKQKSFFVEIVSERGKALVERFREFFNQTRFTKPRPSFKCRKRLDTRNLKEALDKGFFHPIWKKEAARELNCTACTQVCPSCYCFLSFDRFIFDSQNSERFRSWDSCHLKRFSRVAGGQVFRESRESRLRQFIMHKLSYFQENHEMPLCVGCGRCITVCPVGIDLTQIASVIVREFNERPDGTKNL